MPPQRSRLQIIKASPRGTYRRPTKAKAPPVVIARQATVSRTPNVRAAVVMRAPKGPFRDPVVDKRAPNRRPQVRATTPSPTVRPIDSMSATTDSMSSAWLRTDSNWTEAWEPRATAASKRMSDYLDALGFKGPGDARPLRVLYLSCHGPLEHDELTLFGELGYEWVRLANSGEVTRPRETVRTVDFPVGCVLPLQSRFGNADPSNVPPELLEWADVMIVMYEHPWLIAHANRFGSKPIIWRAIGQAMPEQVIAHLRKRVFCVRMSPRECHITGYVGTDATIRFYKDPEEFSGWTGERSSVISIMGMPNLRRRYSRIDVLETVLQQVPDADLFGLGSDHDIPSVGRGTITYTQLKESLRSARVFLTVGSLPGPYTLSLVEAMMTGCPIATIGHGLWSRHQPQVAALYETPELLAGCGFVSDDVSALVQEVSRLLGDVDYAREMSVKTRQRAIELFGKPAASALWRAVLDPIRARIGL
jgi:hypothetical protein